MVKDELRKTPWCEWLYLVPAGNRRLDLRNGRRVNHLFRFQIAEECAEVCEVGCHGPWPYPCSLVRTAPTTLVGFLTVGNVAEEQLQFLLADVVMAELSKEPKRLVEE